MQAHFYVKNRNVKIKTKDIKKITIIIAIIFVAALAMYFYGRQPVAVETGITLETEFETVGNGETPAIPNDPETLAENLDVPWEIAFLPDGDFLITERPGNVKRIGTTPATITVADVESVGEGGLLGMAIHPDFSQNNWIYLYFTTRSGGVLKNVLARYIFSGNGLADRQIIIDDIPAGSNHDGGRIAFGPDGYLYVTTGDAGRSGLSQDTNSLAGKILRVKDDGSIPEDNPFGSAVYSYGHRNVQGITWDEEGRLWATEHGRSGVLSGYDELNLIRKGANYGWPEIQGDEEKDGMEKPMAHSGPSSTWAPSGATFHRGSIFFTGLRGQALYEYDIQENKIIEHLKGRYGRLRNVSMGPDGSFYILTNNTDGRGNPRSRDDIVIRLSSNVFGKSESIPSKFLAAPMDNAAKRINKKTFGMFITPENSPVEDDKFRGFHTGADWEVFPDEIEKDVLVKAVCSGTLKIKKMASGYGGVAVEECEFKGEPITIVYGHMNLESIERRVGEKIEEGEVLGILGKHKSPETDGARKHLHLSIHRGKEFDIKGYVDARDKLSSWIDPASVVAMAKGSSYSISEHYSSLSPGGSY